MGAETSAKALLNAQQSYIIFTRRRMQWMYRKWTERVAGLTLQSTCTGHVQAEIVNAKNRPLQPTTVERDVPEARTDVCVCAKHHRQPSWFVASHVSRRWGMTALQWLEGISRYAMTHSKGPRANTAAPTASTAAWIHCMIPRGTAQCCCTWTHLYQTCVYSFSQMYSITRHSLETASYSMRCFNLLHNRST